ncbi:MAG: hypothetical protein Q9221_008069 [Calogaya cf. arnoldii]
MAQAQGGICVSNVPTDEPDAQQISKSQYDAKRSQEAQDFINLVSLMYKKCPQEVVDHIKYWTFELVFCPGHIVCDRYPEDAVCGWPKASPARPTLLALSKAIQTKYQQRLMTENTYFIASTKYLNPTPRQTWRNIRKLKLAFTVRDLGTGWAGSIPPPGTYHEYPDSSTILGPQRLWAISRGNVIENNHTCHKASTTHQSEGPCHQCLNMELAKCWSNKALMARTLDLEPEELTLDLTECYDSRGYWMGGVVADNLSWIRRKFPGMLEVLGPDGKKQKELFARILGLAQTGLLGPG